MSLCVFIPVFNEQEIILNTLKDIHSCLKKSQIDFELIIINDFWNSIIYYPINYIYITILFSSFY